MGSVKLVLLFGFVLALVRFRVKIGISILIGAVAAGLIFGMQPIPLCQSIVAALGAKDTWQLFVILMSVSMLGSLLKQSGLASALTDAVEAILHSKRASMATLPALIGLLPMPGGALLSAPLVDSAGGNTGVGPRKLAAINYWFRHVLEYIWPLYPGIILSASILDVKASEVIIAQWPMSVGMIVGGILFLLLPLGMLTAEGSGGSFAKNGRAVFTSMWPIFGAVILSLVCGVPLYYSVPAATLAFVVISRFPAGFLVRAVRDSLTIEYGSFVFSVMIFKQVFSDSGAAESVAAEITSAGIAPLWIVIFIPFIVGLISGATPAFVSLSYPALLPFLRPGEVDFVLVATAYTAGFLGVLLSPLHFCLVLTADYFKTDLLHVYAYLVGPLIFMLLGVAARAVF